MASVDRQPRSAQLLSRSPHLGLLMLGGTDGAANTSVDLVTGGGGAGRHQLPRPLCRGGPVRPPAARPPRGQARGRGGAAAGGAGAALLRGLGRGGPRGGHLLAAAGWAWQLGGEPRPAPRRGAGGPGQCVLLLARCSCAVQVVAGNKLYVAGGLARGAALDTLQVFDGDTWTWSLEQVSSSSSSSSSSRARLG